MLPGHRLCFLGHAIVPGDRLCLPEGTMCYLERC
jgi:hypothetical protein